MSEVREPPGSQIALDNGCTCPVVDNWNGAGIRIGKKQLYWHHADCPYHVWSKPKTEMTYGCDDWETNPEGDF